MEFTNQDIVLEESIVEAVEERIGIRFPSSLRSLFLESNGGEPDPYVYRSETLHTVVSETLPLISNAGRGTAVEAYQRLVSEQALVEEHFFPFAVDAGGDYFFIDCTDPDGAVYFFRSDSAFQQEPLEKVSSSLEGFWNALEPEEE